MADFSGPQGSSGAVLLQLNEITTGLHSLVSTIDVRHAQVDQLQEFLRKDLASLRRDQHDLEEKLDCVICVMQHDLEELRAQGVQHARSVAELIRTVESLTAPVAEIVALRTRIGGLLLALGFLGSAATWLAEPIYRWFIEQHFLKS